jgi:hypothetical protein
MKSRKRGAGGAPVWVAGTAGVAVSEDFDFNSTGEIDGGECGVDDFRADACRISQGDDDAWHGRE